MREGMEPGRQIQRPASLFTGRAGHGILQSHRLALRRPIMRHDDPLIYVLKLILCEGWKLPANQQSDEVNRCATILLKRIRAGDSYPSLLSYVTQLRNSLGLRTSEPSIDTKIVDRIMALARNVRQD
jgi:hypothetical protein